MERLRAVWHYGSERYVSDLRGPSLDLLVAAVLSNYYPDTYLQHAHQVANALRASGRYEYGWLTLAREDTIMEERTLTLTITTETYSRTESGRSWRSKPDTTETETLPWHDRGEDKHRKITDTDTLRWFRRIGGSEHAVRSYTPAGYIVTRLVSTNPDRTVRIVRKFHVTNAT